MIKNGLDEMDVVELEEKQDMGMQDMGMQDMGMQDMGIQDMGIQDVDVDEMGIEYVNSVVVDKKVDVVIFYLNKCS